MGSRALVERFLQAALAVNVDEIVDLMAEDGYMEWPFRPAGVPPRLTGREKIRAYLMGASKAPISFDEFRDMVVHETTDPAVVIVEYTAHGTLTSTGAPYEQQIIAVYTVRDGRIAAIRDYLNPMALAEARAAH